MVLFLFCFLIVDAFSVVPPAVFLVLTAKRSLTRSSAGGLLASIRAATSETVLYKLIMRRAATRCALLMAFRFLAVFIAVGAHTLVAYSILLYTTLDSKSILLALGPLMLGIILAIFLAVSVADLAIFSE